MRIVAGSLAVLAIGLAGSGAASGGQTKAGACGTPGGGSPRAATPPATSHVRLTQLAQVKARLPFEPLLPPGRPYRIYLVGGSGESYRLEVAYVVAPGRWFRLTEHEMPSAIATLFDGTVLSASTHSECGERNTAVHLSDGRLALLMEEGNLTVLRFYSGRMAVMLLSSSQGASPSFLLKVANKLGS